MKPEISPLRMRVFFITFANKLCDMALYNQRNMKKASFFFLISEIIGNFLREETLKNTIKLPVKEKGLRHEDLRWE